jgi:hypothetical protein
VEEISVPATRSTADATRSFTYTEDGVYKATLIVTDSTGRRAWAWVRIVVGNTIPVLTLTAEPAGGTFRVRRRGRARSRRSWTSDTPAQQPARRLRRQLHRRT